MTDERNRGGRRIVTAQDLLASARDGRFALQPGDLLSPLVHETAERHGIRLVSAGDAAAASRERLLLWDPGDPGAAAVLEARLERGRASVPPERTVVAAPFPWLARLRGRGCGLAVYSVAPWEAGAYTGEISARMAVDAGAAAVVLGLPAARRLPRVQQALLPRRVEKALAHGLVPYVGVSLADEDFEAVRSFALIRSTVANVLAGAGRAAAGIRWFWCHPSTRPARLAAPEVYVQELADALRACGAAPAGPVGSFHDVPGASRGEGPVLPTFLVERV